MICFLVFLGQKQIVMMKKNKFRVYPSPRSRPEVLKLLVPTAIMLPLNSQSRKISRVQFSKYWEIKLLIISRGKYHSTCTQVAERNFGIRGEQHHKHFPTVVPCPSPLVDSGHTNHLPHADEMAE